MTRNFIILMLLVFTTPAFAASGGKADYNAKCAGCHGANDNVQTEKARALKMDVNKLSLKNSRKSKNEMIDIVEKGKGAMPAFKQDLSSEQIAAIIDYVMSLRSK